jgi:hypothetical protein
LPSKVLAYLKSALWKPSIVGVVALVFLWNWAFSYESVKEQFPFLVTAQLRFHQFLSYLSPQPQYVKLVRLVDINDRAHWKEFGGAEPTSRAFLGDLVSQCSQEGNKAAAIAIDVQLKAPLGFAAGQDNPQWDVEDTQLLASIQEAVDRGVPIILGVGLVKNSAGDWTRQPSIFSDRELPLRSQTNDCEQGACVAMGYVNLPLDMRQIPLQTFATSDHSAPAVLDSLALATVTAYEQKMDLEPRTIDKPRIAQSLATGKFVYGSFIPARTFEKQAISAFALSKGDPTERKKCEGHIILIGGTWHSLQGMGPLADGYDSPVGEMSGVLLFANYIETLLDNRFQSEVPLWIGLTFDFIFAGMLYAASHAVGASRYKWWIVWSVFLLLLLSVYILFANLNRYLDFVLPLTLCFAHLGYERVEPFAGLEKWTRKLRKKPAEGDSSPPAGAGRKEDLKQQESDTSAHLSRD